MLKIVDVNLEAEAAKRLKAGQSPYHIAEQLGITLGTVARVLTWLAYPSMANFYFKRNMRKRS